QGVGVRDFTEAAAGREGIGGWVRNADDGAVEAFAEGDEEALLRFERAIRLGPAGARVDNVLVTSEVPAGRVAMFTIRA
ncbi:MAG: acylphosphatase, partial [Vicinamibacterales bacterium]